MSAAEATSSTRSPLYHPTCHIVVGIPVDCTETTDHPILRFQFVAVIATVSFVTASFASIEGIMLSSNDAFFAFVFG